MNIVKYLIVVYFLISSTAHAQTGSLNLSLPGTYGSYQSDSFRANGLDCSMAIGSSTNVEFGVVGVINRDAAVVSTVQSDPGKNIGVYGRITIPIGAPRDRLDCNQLYQLELRKKRIEIQKLERELENLKNLKFENK